MASMANIPGMANSVNMASVPGMANRPAAMAVVPGMMTAPEHQQ